MRLELTLNGDSPKHYASEAMSPMAAGIPKMPRTHLLDQLLMYTERGLMVYAIYRVVTSEDGFKDLVRSRF